MEKVVERIQGTKAHSIQRAHEVENFIDTELSFNDVHFLDMEPETIIELKKHLKQEKNNQDIKDMVYEVIEEIESIKKDLKNT